MNTQFKTSITYFLCEGRDNLRECLRIAFSAALNHRIEKLVVFTAEGQGIRIALDVFCSQPAFRNIKLIAVTFPIGKRFTDASGNPLFVDIPSSLQSEMRERGIPIIRAHLPFDPITATRQSQGVLGQDLTLVENALNIFGGSMSLCVQAVSIACDAGAIPPGDHVIALTSDTAVLAQAAPTNDLLRGFAIREILCKPAIYTIGRGESTDQLTMPLGLPTAELDETIEPIGPEGIVKSDSGGK
jgi:hypothetical protein